MRPPVLVLSDLDGTLLDHHDYSWRKATRALERLRRERIPLVLASSKTRVEMQAIRRDLDNHHPFVVENGAAIYVPYGTLEVGAGDGEGVELAGEPHTRIALGRDRAEILELLHAIRRRLGLRFEGFADWSVEQVAERTGLDLASAAAATERDATEPLLWLDRRQPPERLERELARRRLRLVAGGRFLHAMGEADKGTAARWLIERYGTACPDLVTVSLGDSPNDLEMLRCADIAVVIPRAAGEPLDPVGPRCVIRVEDPGAAGWREGIDRCFALLADWG